MDGNEGFRAGELASIDYNRAGGNRRGMFGDGPAGTRKMPNGESDLDDLIRKDQYYVDKTMILRKICDMDENKVFLFTRPRRFGKTWLLNMADLFFNMKYEGQKFRNQVTGADQDFFEGTMITRDAEFCRLHRNRFPVIHLDFKAVMSGSFKAFRKGVAFRLSRMFTDNIGLRDVCVGNERMKFDHMERLSASEEELLDSIRFMTELMHRRYGTKAVVLIDEYENSIHKMNGKMVRDPSTSEATSQRQRAIEFMGGLLTDALKGNADLQMAIITGITEIVDHDIFSGLNNIYRNSIFTRDVTGMNPFGDCFGYTMDEVRRIVYDYGGTESEVKVAQDYYDGYDFGAGHVFNPLSFNNFINSRFGAGRFWVAMSDNAVLRNFSSCLDDASTTIRRLQESKVPFKYIGMAEGISYTRPPSSGDLLGLMAHAGYLNAAPTGKGSHMIGLPNQEIREVFPEEVLSALGRAQRTPVAYVPGLLGEFTDALLNGRADDLQECLQHLVNLMVDPKAMTDENAFRLFVTGITAPLLGMYDIATEAMSGDGYADLALRAVGCAGPNLVLEFKRASGKGGDGGRLARKALSQI